MNEIIRFRPWLLLLLVGMSPICASAGTLYEWVDKSGDTRYGYRPPPGVIGTAVGEKIRQRSESASSINCRELREEHLRLLDKEIERVRNLPAGLGPTFEFTLEARQRFINDLLAHRAAFITGREPEQFTAPDKKREISDLKQKYQKDKAKLVEDLEFQARQLQQERQEVERQRRDNELIIQRYRSFYPGMPYPLPPY